MPIIVAKAVPALLALVFSLSLLIPHSEPVYKTILDINGQQAPVIIYLDKDKPGGIRVVYKRSGKDVTLFYDRQNELTDFDQQVVESLIAEINKSPTIGEQFREKVNEGLKSILRQGIIGNPAKKKWER